MTAALFPGQGSQFVGMGKSFYDEFKSARACFEEASDAAGVDYKKLCFEGPESELMLTENTQPCLLVVSYAVFQILREVLDFRPRFGAGHSLGEYSALAAAGALKFGEAVVAVKKRGRFMQEAVPLGQGAMAAVLGLEDEEVKKFCLWAESEFGEKPLEPANFNSPGQVVVSGKKSLLDKALAAFNGEKVLGVQKRVKFIPLKVSAPFHCSLMKPAEEKMSPILRSLTAARAEFPVVQNASAREEREPTAWIDPLIRQISSPVLWTQSVRRLKELGMRKVVECGPGKVLSGLVKKIDSETRTFNIQTLDDIRNLEKDVSSGSVSL
jgi:[acyl-carrier-protein] S-malonyltransferase